MKELQELYDKIVDIEKKIDILNRQYNSRFESISKEFTELFATIHTEVTLFQARVKDEKEKLRKMKREAIEQLKGE